MFTCNERTNNYRAALVARAAYLSDPVRAAAARKLFEEEMKDDYDAQVFWWGRRNACGCLIELDCNQLIIGIGGTNDLDDAITDVHFSRTMLNGEWGAVNGINVDKDARGVQTTAGFAGYLALCYAAITECAVENSVSCASKKIVLCGHSLGGATVQLLQLCEPYEDSISYAFCGARPFYPAAIPSRVRHATIRTTDPVVYQPWCCRHADATYRYVTRTGIRPGPTLTTSSCGSVVNLIVWSAGMVGSLLAKCGLMVPKSMQITYGHGLDRLIRDIE